MVSERLKELRNRLGLSQRKMGELLSIAQTTYANYESGKANIPDELKIKLIEVADLNTNWLLTGSGNMLLSDDPETSSPVFKTPSGRELEAKTSIQYSVPILASRVSAGGGAEWEAEDFREERMPAPLEFFMGYPKEEIFAAEVVGDSMQDIDLLDGDYVFACHGVVKGNGIYVLTLETEVYVKRLEIDVFERKVRVISENRHYQDKIVDMDRVVILGKVIGWLHRNVN